MTNVISMKDWVPGWVRNSYLTEDEIDAFNQECYQSEVERQDVGSASDNQALLVKKAIAKLESLDRNGLEKWLHRIPPALLVDLVEKS